MPSIAGTFVGPAIATTSERSPENETGTASRGLAAALESRFAAAMSTWKTLRSRWSSPLRSAIARASWSSVIAPQPSRTSSAVLAPSRAAWTAASARSRSVKPSSTMTSVRKRGPPWRWRGYVIPSAAAAGAGGSGAGAVGAATGRRWGKLGRLMLPACGPAHHVQRSAAPGPYLKAPRALADEDLETVDAPAAPLLGLPQEVGAAVPVDQVHHARVFPQVIGLYRDLLERLRGVVQADGRAVHEHVGRPWTLDRRNAEIRREAPGALGAPVPHEALRSHVAQRVRGGARAAARAEDERGARRRVGERIEEAGRVGVVGPDRAVGAERQRVRRADRRGVVRAVRGDGERRLLVGDRHVEADEPRRRHRRDGLGERVRLDRDRLVGELAVEPDRGERGVLHRRRAAVGDRPADDREAPQAHGPTPPSRSGTIRTTTPGGGSSIGGNFTSAPRYLRARR